MQAWPHFPGLLAETLVRKTPNSAARLERLRGVFSRWAKVAQEASAAK